MTLSLGRILGLTATAAVSAAVVAALLIVDGPATERAQRIDAHRVADLRALAGALACARHGSAVDLPDRLEDLPSDCRHGGLADPETGVPYGYRRLAADRYELCADFARPSASGDGVWQADWTHGAGHVCFERTIDVPAGQDFDVVP